MRRTYLAGPLPIAPASSGHVPAAAFGDALEVQATFALPAAASGVTSFGVSVRGGTGGAERVTYYPALNEVGAGGLSGAERRTRAVLSASGNVTLRVFVDRSIVEVYCAGAAITTRTFPREPYNATSLDVFAVGGTATLLRIDVWAMGSMWGRSSGRSRAAAP
jgi:fructan beta-fructosidase